MYLCTDLTVSTFVNTMRTNLPKLLDLLIFCIYSLNFSLEFFIMIFFVTNQLNISKFLPLQICKTLISYYLIETKLHQFSRFLLIVFLMGSNPIPMFMYLDMNRRLSVLGGVRTLYPEIITQFQLLPKFWPYPCFFKLRQILLQFLN